MEKDLASGILMLLLAVVVYYGATEIGTSFMADPVGPAALPKALAVALGAFSLLLIAQSLVGLWKRRREASAKASEKPRRRHLLALGMLAIGVGYVLIAESVGYLVGIALLLLAVILYQGASWTWRPPVIALGGAIFFWLLFVKLLSIGQPEGIWHRLLASLGV
jgi:putative tricarboxylic transport membrane protein